MATFLSLSAVPVTDPDTGDRVDGALLYAYVTETTTDATVYQDAALEDAHAQPVVADADGVFEPVFLDDAVQYRVVIKSADDAITYLDIDPVNPASDSASALSAATAAASAAAAAAQDAADTAQSAAQSQQADYSDLFVLKAGDSMNGALSKQVSGSDSLVDVMIGESGSLGQQFYRVANDATAPIASYLRGRGTYAAPAAVVTGDEMYRQTAAGYGGLSYRTAFRLIINAQATTPSETDMESRLVMSLVPAGSVTLTEIFRLQHATGLSLFSSVVIDQDRGHQLRARTVAELASLTATAGRMFYCSDETGGAVPVFGDGAVWRRVTDRTVAS